MLHFSETNDRRQLVECAMGRRPADMVIRQGQWVCVQSGEIIPNTDIAILDGRISYVGSDAQHTIGEHTQVIQAENRFLVPGLLDGHMHVESSMLTITEFVRAVVPHGTTGLFIDPHEIANVFGLPGVRLMVDEAALQPIHVFVQMPSCVPSAPGLETPGATIGPTEVAEAISWPGVIGLGEVMNFPGVNRGDEAVHVEMNLTRKAGKVISGHYASADLGLSFHGYAAAGAEDDHEGTCLEDVLARARQGLKPMLRYGSAWHDVASQVIAITELGLDPRHFILCTDDSHCATLLQDGHMDRVVRHAIHQGLPPMCTIQMATINTAQHFKLDREMGIIAPGRWADIVLVKDLTNFQADKVIARGNLVAEEGCLLADHPDVHFPEWVLHSVHIPRRLTSRDFSIITETNGPIIANVIGIIENQAITHHLRMELQPNQNHITPDPQRDLAKVAIIERHHNSGRIQVSLVHGFGFTERCAVGTTVAHDCHHLIVVGTYEDDMALAANTLTECSGGQVVVKNGDILARVELPIAGLMSTERAEFVAQKTNSVLEGFRMCGCNLNNPNMQLSLLALVVIPELRISDLGLIDVHNFRFIRMIENGEGK